MKITESKLRHMIREILSSEQKTEETEDIRLVPKEQEALDTLSGQILNLAKNNKLSAVNPKLQGTLAPLASASS